MFINRLLNSYCPFMLLLIATAIVQLLFPFMYLIWYTIYHKTLWLSMLFICYYNTFSSTLPFSLLAIVSHDCSYPVGWAEGVQQTERGKHWFAGVLFRTTSALPLIALLWLCDLFFFSAFHDKPTSPLCVERLWVYCAWSGSMSVEGKKKKKQRKKLKGFCILMGKLH